MPRTTYVTIGKVVKRLQQSYPDLTVSKVRYLEDEGLLHLERSSGGYRLFTPQDIKRLETILYLQKTRFLPLSVIKEELDGNSSTPVAGVDAFPQAIVDTKDVTDRLHPIDSIPEKLGVSVAFVRQLAQCQLIELKSSPRQSDLVDGRDFALIRSAEALRHFGIEPRNLKPYVMAANRESPLIDQVLSFIGARVHGNPKEQWEAKERAFEQIISLTGNVRAALVRRNLAKTLTPPKGQDAS